MKVGGHQHGRLAILFQHSSQLAAGCGLTTSLQAAHHDDSHTVAFDGKFVVARHQVDQTLMDDAHDLLIRSQRFQHFSADRFLSDLLYEVLRNIERNVGFQQSGAHLLHPVADVAFRDLSGSPESRKGVR